MKHTPVKLKKSETQGIKTIAEKQMFASRISALLQ
jgi:hypothetical protein